MRIQAHRSIFYCALYYTTQQAPRSAAAFSQSSVQNIHNFVRTKSSFVTSQGQHRPYFTGKIPILYAKGSETSSSSPSNAVVKKAKAKTTSSKKKNKSTKKKTKSKRKMSTTKGKKKKEEAPAIPHAPESIIAADFDQTRTKLLTTNATLPREKSALKNPCVFYWMSRDVRTCDNWALLFAQSLAVQKKVPLRVVYALPPPPSDNNNATEGQDDGSPPPNPVGMSMTERHGTFLLDGLKVVAKELSSSQVPFDVICPTSRETVGESIHSHCVTSSLDALAVVCDMSPLRLPRKYAEEEAAPLLEQSEVPLYQVDAHNIVPVWIASPKREVGARTLRPKINKVFADYCTQFPPFQGNCHMESDDDEASKNHYDWDKLKAYLKLDTSIAHIPTMKAGHEVAMERFRAFCSSPKDGLKNFDSLRNDPNFPSVCSNLSPWINYGQVSFQRLALDVRALKKHPNGTAAYIEEGVVRRELSDNYVYYTPDNYGKSMPFF